MHTRHLMNMFLLILCTLPSRPAVRISYPRFHVFLGRGPPLNPSGTAGLIKGIKEVEEMLLFNIAQAQMNERGNYGESVLSLAG